MSNFDATIQDLVIANRIRATEEVVDAYGHVSVRHPDNPNRFLIARSLAPELVSPEDIVELDLEGQPVRDEDRSLYLERFIHAAILAARPDVMAVVHAHAEDTLPFGIAQGTKLRPVIHSGGFIGIEVPVWDIADNSGDTNLLVTNMAQASDLAKCLGENSVALMRGHGFASAARFADRGRAGIGLPAAQRTRADAGAAAGRPDQVPVARRDRGPQHPVPAARRFQRASFDRGRSRLLSRGGTDGSNPSPSRGESANFRSLEVDGPVDVAKVFRRRSGR